MNITGNNKMPAFTGQIIMMGTHTGSLKEVSGEFKTALKNINTEGVHTYCYSTEGSPTAVGEPSLFMYLSKDTERPLPTVKELEIKRVPKFKISLDRIRENLPGTAEYIQRIHDTARKLVTGEK